MYTDKLKFLVMDLTAVADASDEQEVQGHVKWVEVFKANSWEEVSGIEDSGVKEVVRTMEMNLSNPMEREWLRLRRDAGDQ